VSITVKLSEAQIWLMDYLPSYGPVEAEFKFHPTRKWRFDVAIPQARLAFEIDGGVWARGRHTRGKGFVGDMEKLNAAQAMGWRVFRFTPQQVLNGTVKQFCEEYL
jgi:very-short-patch-repair endonuclease